MNIFATSSNPKACAEYLDNKRVNKMILESAQMLSCTLNADVVKYLIEKRRVDVNKPDLGEYPLLTETRCNQPEIVNILIISGNIGTNISGICI